MADRWKSHEKYYCKYCNIYMLDNRPTRAKHDSGYVHKENMRLFLADVRRRTDAKAKEEKEMRDQLRKIEQAANKQYRQDLASLAAEGVTLTAPPKPATLAAAAAAPSTSYYGAAGSVSRYDAARGGSSSAAPIGAGPPFVPPTPPLPPPSSSATSEQIDTISVAVDADASTGADTDDAVAHPYGEWRKVVISPDNERKAGGGEGASDATKAIDTIADDVDEDEATSTGGLASKAVKEFRFQEVTSSLKSMDERAMQAGLPTTTVSSSFKKRSKPNKSNIIQKKTKLNH